MSEAVALKQLRDYPVVVTVAVAWGDMDYFRHVNNTVYFRYFESARIAYLERIGFAEDTGSGVGPILASTEARFRSPLTYPDRIRIGARTLEVEGDRFRMEYRIVREHGGRIAADGAGVIVAYDYRNGRKTQLPDSVRQAIIDIENGAMSNRLDP